MGKLSFYTKFEEKNSNNDEKVWKGLRRPQEAQDGQKGMK